MSESIVLGTPSSATWGLRVVGRLRFRRTDSLSMNRVSDRQKHKFRIRVITIVKLEKQL